MFQVESNSESLILSSETARLRIGFITESIARVTITGKQPFRDRPSLAVIANPWHSDYTVQDIAAEFRIATVSLAVTVSKSSGALQYFDGDGRLLVREPDRGGKWLTPTDDPRAFHATLEFVFSGNEALFGLGSHEEGYGNLRGKSRELYQHNLKAVVPYFVSTRGYGVLMDCYSFMTFHDDALGSYMWADVVEELDYYFIRGEHFADVTRGYHTLTGRAPLPPKWFFGYAQSKERYVSAAELVDTVCNFRRRGIPLDLIVLDWKSWPDSGGWGQKSLDPARFPAPQELTANLHRMGTKLMVSVWPNLTGESIDRKELLERGLMLGNYTTYNAFQQEARRTYWEQANRGLFSNGVDAWWCDCTEPFESDWKGEVKPEPHERLSINVGESKRYLDPGYISAFSLLHSRGMYEGQRSVTNQKRVVNLTRSSYAGQHRYAATTWSGDICATWETLRRSIPEGLNFCAAGEPYWTLDIGGFFVQDDRTHWFWRGDYDAGCRGLTDAAAKQPDPRDTGCTDLGYWELYTRWLQYAVFLPMFRSHGTDAPREPWRFGEPGNPFYDTIVRYIRFRYELLPYVYSVAAQVSLNSWSIIRAVALDFPNDLRTHDLTDQYLFGPGLMVCPVTMPMYYGPCSKPIVDAPKSRPVYLPAATAWCDFHTDSRFRGGSMIETPAPLEVIPLFVRTGAIIPMTAAAQYADEVRDAAYEIRVYTGSDGVFPLYEDEADNYNYEHGRFSIVPLRWSEAAGELTIGARTGSFDGMVTSRDYRIVFISGGQRETRDLTYGGEEVRVRP